MQPTKRRLDQAKRKLRRPASGRVVDLRHWKAEKRMRNYRSGRGSWPMMKVVLIALAALSGGAAIGSCIPSAWQTRCIVLSWFFAVIGCLASIIFHAFRRRFALRMLIFYIVFMAVSLVPAVIKVATSGP